MIHPVRSSVVSRINGLRFTSNGVQKGEISNGVKRESYLVQRATGKCSLFLALSFYVKLRC